LRRVKWDAFKAAGLEATSSLEIGDGWMYYSAANRLDVAILVGEHIWPEAQVQKTDNEIVFEATAGRWIATIDASGGLLIAKENHQPETFPAFWGDGIEGCQLYMSSVNLPYMKGVSDEGVMLAFFHTDSTVHIRIPRSGKLPKLFRKRSLKKWKSLSSLQQPSMAAAFGEEPLSVLDTSLFVLPKDIKKQDIQDLDKKLHMGTGVQVATLGNDVVVSVPLQGWFGCPLARWQIEWGLRKFEQVAKHRRKVFLQEKEWFVEAQRGRIVAASSQAVLDEVLNQKGTPWFADVEGEPHFLATINIPQSMMMFVGPLDSVSFTLAGEETYWDLNFFASTKSKAKPNQLFLTYFATLQQWEKPSKVSVPPAVDLFLKAAAQAQRNQLDFVLDPSLEYPFPAAFFSSYKKQGQTIFLEDVEGNTWFRNPQEGTQICTEGVTSSCQPVN